MADAAERVAFVVRGVVRHALRAAGQRELQLIGAPGAESRLIERWCAVRFSASGLATSGANKTELLLGEAPMAALYPLGDLYASEIAGLCGTCTVSPVVHDLWDMAGGADRLDEALRRLLDERREVPAAFQHIPALREPVLRRLQQTRFRRLQAGIVPKLGARTIGIDLFI